VLFHQLLVKFQGKTRKDRARPALFLIFVFFYVFFVLFYVFLCCSMYFCVVLCIDCFVTLSVFFVCICVLSYCHRVATQLQLNISYRIIYSDFRGSIYNFQPGRSEAKGLTKEWKQIILNDISSGFFKLRHFKFL
jgi:hypothetical protein